MNRQSTFKSSGAPNTKSVLKSLKTLEKQATDGLKKSKQLSKKVDKALVVVTNIYDRSLFS